MSLDPNKPEIIDTSEVDVDYNFMRQDSGGMITNSNGVADRLLRNNALYREMKGDWKRVGTNKTKNIITTTGRQDGKFYISREQKNTEYIALRCKEYRAAAEAGWHDPLAPLMPDGKLGYKWMDLPDVIAIRISDQYFGGMPWSVIKLDRTLKAQFYKVVQQEYPQYVCFPGGKMPIPIDVPYPVRAGETKFFKGL